MVIKTVQQYQITEKIGGDGMGVVWKALDTRLRREVALKFLPERSSSDAGHRERFLREAKAASALNHPNIVTIYEINSDDGQLFIAMELVRGRTLAEVMHERKVLPAALAIDYVTQLCDGLGAAHRAGVIHRDIKPSNVMVTHDGVIKILDFGLAKSAVTVTENPSSTDSTVERPLTQAGVLVGTVPYMSPEQVVGGPIDARADVFAVGIVLYEMLSGRRPFPGSTNPEILRALMFTEPVPLRSLVPDVPEPLAEIAHHCLQKNVEHRFKDATVVAARLRVPQKTTDGPIAKDVIRRPARRHALTATLGLLLGATAIAGFLWTPSRKDAATSSTASVVNVAETLKQAEGYLQRFDKKGNSDRAIATLEPSIQLNGSSPSLSATLAEAYVRKFTETSDKKWLSKAIDTARGAVADNEDLASAHVALGQALAASGQTAEALQEFTRARDLNPLSGPAHLGLAGLQSKSRDAEDLFLKAVQYSPDEWLPLSSLAVFYYREARYDESVAKWREALQLAPDNTRVMVNLAAGFHMLGQYSLAADILQRALALDDTAASTWANLSTARYFQGNFREGVRAAEKAVELAPGKYLYWGNLGDSYRWVEESRGKAHSAYENAIRLVRDQLALTPNDSNLRSSLAVYLAKSGDTAAATMELTKLADLASGDRGTLFKTALTYELLHDRNHALAALERAIAAKYSMHEIANEPELAALRSDARYSRIAR